MHRSKVILKVTAWICGCTDT